MIRTFILGLITVSAPLSATAGEWTDALQSKVRMEPGGVHAAGDDPGLWSGVTIRYAKGWKTYWRNPGDAGISPRFDWSGSINLKAVDVHYPAPERFFDGYAYSIGYGGTGVTLPLAITPENEDRPVVLSLALDYAVCERICVPERVELTAIVRHKPINAASPIVAALSSVPPMRKGRVLSARLDLGAPSASLNVAIAETGDDIWAFGEGPGGEPMLMPDRVSGGDSTIFRFPLDGLPPEARAPGEEFRITVTTAEGAYETRAAAE